jgi:hypothetical protein
MANKTQTISARVMTLIASGMTPIDALKAVCGAEMVDDMIDRLYHELRAKAQQPR